MHAGGIAIYVDFTGNCNFECIVGLSQLIYVNLVVGVVRCLD